MGDTVVGASSYARFVSPLPNLPPPVAGMILSSTLAGVRLFCPLPRQGRVREGRIDSQEMRSPTGIAAPGVHRILLLVMAAAFGGAGSSLQRFGDVCVGPAGRGWVTGRRRDRRHRCEAPSASDDSEASASEGATAIDGVPEGSVALYYRARFDTRTQGPSAGPTSPGRRARWAY